MTTVAVIDYGLCNLDSIARALEKCGARVLLADGPGPIGEADRLVLPGVGAFPAAMRNLRQRGLADALLARVADGQTPLLGICLGMQLLAEHGCEFGGADGLGLIPGEVIPLRPAKSGERVPHMGWNALERRSECALFDAIEADRDFYFVHSFHLTCADPSDVLATTPYCGGFVSVVRRGNVFGTQFHPEKSQRAGFALLRNFLSL